MFTLSFFPLLTVVTLFLAPSALAGDQVPSRKHLSSVSELLKDLNITKAADAARGFKKEIKNSVWWTHDGTWHHGAGAHHTSQKSSIAEATSTSAKVSHSKASHIAVKSSATVKHHKATKSHSKTTDSHPKTTQKSHSHSKTVKHRSKTAAQHSKTTKSHPKTTTKSHSKAESRAKTTSKLSSKSHTTTKVHPVPVKTSAAVKTPKSSSAALAASTSSPIAKEALADHNALRAKHDADPLVWNITLQNAAQAWANKCVFQHGGGVAVGSGENIAAATGSSGNNFTSQFDMWASEEPQYNTTTPVTSHYTQVVWKGTKSVGCAMQKCDLAIFPASYGAAYFTVCEYYPPGNVLPNQYVLANVD